MKQAIQAEKLDQENRLKERMSLIRHKLIVMSGKGGVGKTSVAVNLLRPRPVPQKGRPPGHRPSRAEYSQDAGD